jgi:hypothetical protein
VPVQRPGLAAAGPADHDRDAGAALGQVADHGRLVLAGRGVAVQDLPENLRPDDGAVLACPAGRAVHELALQGQQLRCRVAVDAQPPVAADPHRPFIEKPVGRRLNLVQRFLRGAGDREALGQGVHHVRPGEGGHLSGQSVRTGQRVQRRVQLCPGRWTAPSTRANLD